MHMHGGEGVNWTEKYRPNTMSAMTGLKVLKADSASWYSSQQYPPALLFSGPPGTGKTSAARAICIDMHGEDWPANYMVTNASDDRGISFVRQELKGVARVKSPTGKRKIILLDEADGLTPAAQDALRQVIETTSRSTLFILTANNPEKLKSAIVSRCRHYRFSPISPEEGGARLCTYIQKEGRPQEWCEHTEEVISVCNGDMRRALSFLESLSPEPDALLAALRIENFELDSASLALLAGDLSLVSVRINGALERGEDRFTILNGLRRRIRGMLEDDEYFKFMLTWGEFMQMTMEWPSDDQAFFEYFVATLASNTDSSFKNH